MTTLYQNFTLLISSIYRNIHKIKDKEMAHLGLKGTHVTCLFYLYQYGDGHTAADLCKFSSEDKAAISRSVEYLSSGGYIEQGEGTYRQTLILTQKGRETAKYISDKVNDLVAFAGKDMTSTEREILYKSLMAIDCHLKEIVK